MNKYPLWKYVLLVFVLTVSVIFALPNLYAPDPAVQISGQSGATEIRDRTLQAAQRALDEAGIAYFGGDVSEDAKSALIRFESGNDQLLAKSAIKCLGIRIGFWVLRSTHTYIARPRVQIAPSLARDNS